MPDRSGAPSTNPRRCLNADGTPKRAYKSDVTANRFAKRTRRDNLRDAAGLEVYLCPRCSRFHVGHDGKAE